LNREEQDAVRPERFVENFPDAITASTHRHRGRFVWWVLCPAYSATVITCLALLISDALGWIAPMRPILLTAVTTVLTGGTVSAGAGAGFGWLFKQEPTTTGVLEEKS